MDNKIKAQQRANQLQAFNAELNCLNNYDVFKLDNSQRSKTSLYQTLVLKSLTQFKRIASRLIAIDAGRSLETLKLKYSDSSKYLMLRGEVVNDSHLSPTPFICIRGC